MQEPALLLNVASAAAKLGCGRSQLYELLRRGEIVSVRLGRSRRIPAKALADFVEKKIAEAVAENGGNGE